MRAMIDLRKKGFSFCENCIGKNFEIFSFYIVLSWRLITTNNQHHQLNFAISCAFISSVVNSINSLTMEAFNLRFLTHKNNNKKRWKKKSKKKISTEKLKIIDFQNIIS
jgi:hypothetical protein